MRGGRRRRHSPPALTPEQVLDAARQLQAGRLIKQLVIDLGVGRGVLSRALNAQGAYAGILPVPQPGRRGGRPLLSPDKIAFGKALRAAGLTTSQIAKQLNVGRSTARAALNGHGTYAGTRVEA